MCKINEVAVIGPYALKVVTWRWEAFDEDEGMEIDADEESVIGDSELEASGGVWSVAPRVLSELEIEFERC